METFLATYFARISYKGNPKADLQTLKELSRLHTDTIPFENLTPFTNRLISLNQDDIFQKLVIDGRGGYCFEQNGLFSRVLREIGFKVTELGARVLYNIPEETITRKSHMLLRIEIEGQFYLMDVGFGGLTYTRPIKLELDTEQTTNHETYRIKKMNAKELKLQAFVNNDWKTMYRFDLEEQYPIDYEVANYFTSTHPTSFFTTTLIVARPFKDGRMAINDNLFSIYYRNGKVEKHQLDSVDAMKTVITDKFGIQLPDFSNLDERLKSLIIT